jgi:glutamyl-tRNA reductase
MHPELKLVLVGLSHRTAPVAVRERYAVSHEDLPACIRGLIQAPEVSEAAVLSTCNRTEVLVTGNKDADLEAVVSRSVFRNLESNHVYAYEDVHAVIHLFRVTSGLDSLVLGESEVLGQVKQAHELGSKEGTIGELLDPLLQQAMQVGKRVRRETEIGDGTLSVARLAVDIGARVVGSFSKRHAVILGAGDTGLLVARHLRDRNLGRLTLANRTYQRAVDAAPALQAEPCRVEDLGHHIQRADLVFTCIEGGDLELGEETFPKRVLARRDRPLFVADLSVPRAVNPDVRRIEQVLLYDMDDLSKVVEANRRRRSDAAGGSSTILVAELHKFLTLRTFASFTPAIERLRERFETTRDQTLDEVAGPRSSSEALELTHLLTKRLLDVALSQMKHSARHTRSEELLSREYERFLKDL